MLRYYTYYSIGGYKDLFLGTSEDFVESTYYLPLLPVLKESANTDAKAQEEYESLKSLPKVLQLSDKESYHLPSSASPLFSHAGYKILYRHIEGPVHALALRDISCGAKDEMGRSVPFLVVITADSADDVRRLDVIASYIASYLHEAEHCVASFIGYDKDKNGLRFKLAEFNAWIGQILAESASTKIATYDGVIRVHGEKGKVALLILPSGISLTYAKSEQNIKSNEIIAVDMNNVICKADTEKLIDQLEKTAEDLKLAKASNARMKKVMVAAGIGGFLFGATVASCSGK